MLLMWLWLGALAVGQPPPPSDPSLLSARAARAEALSRYGAALWQARRERLLTAVRQLEAAARSDPNATPPRRELVRLYADLGREWDAIRTARQVLEHDPHDVDVAHLLARLLFEAGETREAVTVARRAAAIPLPPARADKTVAVYRDLATLCERAGDLAAAETALRAALELVTTRRRDVIAAAAFTPKEADTAAAECYERLGRVQTRLGKYAEATQSFTAAARLYAAPTVDDPTSAARLAWNLSGVLQAQDQPQAALNQLETFLRLKPRATEPYARQARLLREAGHGAEVVPTLRRQLQDDPANPYLKAVLAAELARDPLTRPEADTLFRQLWTTTADRQVMETIVRSYLEARRPDEVLALLDRTLSTLQDDGEDVAGHAEKPPTPEALAARDLAVEQARVAAEVFRADPAAVAAVVRAAADDLARGLKRTHRLHYFLGQLAAHHRQLDTATVLFRQVLRDAPPQTRGDAYSALIDVLRVAGKAAELRDVCRDGLRHAPEISPHFLNYYLAGALAELGDARGALAAIDAAILQTAAGDRLAVRLQKVRVLQTLGRWDEAIGLARRLLDEFDSPDDQTAIRYALAGAYWGAKKFPEAEAEYRTVLEYDPDHTGACNDLGYHLAEQGRDLAEAERLVRHALAVDRQRRHRTGDPRPENPHFLDSLGWVFFRQGRLTEARAWLERAVAAASDTPDPVIWDHLGDVLFRLGDKDAARSAWEKARDLYDRLSPGAARRHEGRADEVRQKLKRVPGNLKLGSPR